MLQVVGGLVHIASMAVYSTAVGLAAMLHISGTMLPTDKILNQCQNSNHMPCHHMPCHHLNQGCMFDGCCIYVPGLLMARLHLPVLLLYLLFYDVHLLLYDVNLLLLSLLLLSLLLLSLFW